MRHSLLLFSTLVAGCTVGPDYAPPQPGLTPAFIHAAAIDIRSADADWWRGFNDPLLAELVGKAVAGNTDLAQARARIDQSRAAARAAGAALLPAVDATGSVTSASQSRETSIGRATKVLGLGRSYTEYAVGAQASWEVDLFGGLRRGRTRRPRRRPGCRGRGRRRGGRGDGRRLPGFAWFAGAARRR